MKYYLAIDQGGSKTEAVVFTDTGHILAFGDDRGLRNHGESYLAMQGTWIRLAAERALDKIGLTLADLSGTCCSLNGADWPEDYDRLRHLVSKELGLDETDILIVNDCIGAMRGGTSGGNQAVLCAGSGMNCAVRAADGREYIYGYFVNAPDQGGGAIGTKVWQSILDAYTGLGPETCLTQLLLEKYGEPDLVSLYKKFTSAQVAFRNFDLCPLAMRAAKAQDPVAQEIIRVTAERMVQYMELGAQKLNLEKEEITLVMTGGVFKGDGKVLFDAVRNEIHRKHLDFTCTSARYEPVAGAALLLLDTLEPEKRQAALDTFAQDAPHFALKWG